jgi:L-rhamnose mutarotase
MKCYGSLIKIRLEKLEEYKKLPAAVWSEVLDTIKKCSIRNYSIYYMDGYISLNLNTKVRNLIVISQKWLRTLYPRNGGMPVNLVRSHWKQRLKEWWTTMEEVFHCD